MSKTSRTLKTASLSQWRGDTVTTGSPITGMVLGAVVDGIATVYDPSSGLSYSVRVEALTKVVVQ